MQKVLITERCEFPIGSTVDVDNNTAHKLIDGKVGKLFYQTKVMKPKANRGTYLIKRRK